jgi:plastocyanin
VILKRLLLVAVVLVSGLAACGKDDVDPASSGDPTETEEEESTTTTAAEVEAAAIELTATDFAYEADVASVPAGVVAVTISNEGLEEHQATIVRFKDGKAFPDLAAVAESDPGAIGTVIDGFGGPNGAAPEGGVVTSTQSLEAGEYFFMCFIPSPDGVPHAAKGMAMPFTVTDGEAAELEAVENEIGLSEFAFSFEDGGEIPAGEYTIVNEGSQLHEATIYSPAEGSTIDDVKAFFTAETPAEGPPPIVGVGGISATNPNTSALVTLEPGEYVFICFIPDTDGAPHFVKGMLQSVTVT